MWGLQQEGRLSDDQVARYYEEVREAVPQDATAILGWGDTYRQTESHVVFVVLCRVYASFRKRFIATLTRSHQRTRATEAVLL